MYNTLLFDMDGTVLDTLGDLTEAVNYALRHFGEPEHTIDEIRTYVGNGPIKLMERSLPGAVDKDTFEAHLKVYKDYYAMHDRDLTVPYDGIVELMKDAKADGKKIGIVSNKHDSAVVELSDHFFGDLVDVAVGNKPGAKTKPDPAVVYSALKELDATPESCVYIGDSDVDAATAEAAGLDCILVSWGFRPRSLLEKQKAVAVADTVEELREILLTKDQR